MRPDLQGVAISSSLSAHALHFLLALALFAAVAFAGRRHQPQAAGGKEPVVEPPAAHRGPRPATAVPGLKLSGAASLSAGLVHVAVCPQHFREATISGVFFLIAAALQVGWAAATARGVARPTPAWLSAGIGLSAVLVLTWLLSRTTGLPVGPQRWTAEPVGGADVLATGLELGVIVGCVLALRHLRRLRSLHPGNEPSGVPLAA